MPLSLLICAVSAFAIMPLLVTLITFRQNDDTELARATHYPSIRLSI